MKKLIVLSFASTVILAAAATAQESSSTSEPSKTETASATTTSQDVLKKTTHGRAMLTRESEDPEEGRFMRALTACIRYYTNGNR